MRTSLIFSALAILLGCSRESAPATPPATDNPPAEAPAMVEAPAEPAAEPPAPVVDPNWYTCNVESKGLCIQFDRANIDSGEGGAAFFQTFCERDGGAWSEGGTCASDGRLASCTKEHEVHYAFSQESVASLRRGCGTGFQEGP
jgi:hypothetical protein